MSTPIPGPSLGHKLAKTVSPLWDFRVFLLLILAALGSYVCDPAGTLALLGLALFVICGWGAALLVTKIIMPHVSMSDLYRRASYDHRAAALVYTARTLLLIAVGLSLIFWSK